MTVYDHRFRMRGFTWVLLALLIALAIIFIAPNVIKTQGLSIFIQGVGISLALLGLIIGILLVRRTNKRLALLAKVAHSIGEGNYNIRAEDKEYDAIGLVGTSINHMASQIANAFESLESQQRALTEQQKQLAEQNIKLQEAYQQQEDFGIFLQQLNTIDINTIANKGLAYIVEVSHAQLGQLYLYQSDNQLVKIHEIGIDHIALKAFMPSHPEEGLVGEVIRRKTSIIIEDIDENVFPLVNIGFAKVKLCYVIGTPLMFQDKVLGVVLIGSLQKFNQPVLRNLRSIMDALGNTLNNAITYKTVQQQALKLEAANQELLEADRLRSEFVANMSHELRTPLNSIIGFSSILQKNKDENLSKKDLSFVEKIHRNGKHLLGLINDILDLSKIEAGRMDLILTAFELESFVTEIVDMLHTQADAKHIGLKLELKEELPTIYTDSDKLRQVMINLISNAIKFTEKGGVTVQVEQTNQNIIISIIDTGIGIPEDKFEYIFQPFRQADGSTTRKFGGTGLGLTISRSIIERLGGQLKVSSQVDIGSAFSIYFPLEKILYNDENTEINTNSILGKNIQNIVDLSPSLIPSVNIARTPRVLIVDDNVDACELIKNYVEEIGAEAVFAHSGNQALELAKEKHFDLITLDLMMSDMDGWETLRQLKANNSISHIPVVVISIVAEKQQAMVLGAIEAINKPIAQDELLKILRRTLYQFPQAKVLVVDDNKEVWTLFENLLESHVSEIKTAANGQQALEILETYRPDIIFLDLMMPVMDGFTFLKKLRCTPQFMEIPVVVVSAKQMERQEREILEKLATQVMHKGEDQLEQHLKFIIEKQLNSQNA